MLKGIYPAEAVYIPLYGVVRNPSLSRGNHGRSDVEGEVYHTHGGYRSLGPLVAESSSGAF